MADSVSIPVVLIGYRLYVDNSALDAPHQEKLGVVERDWYR